MTRHTNPELTLCATARHAARRAHVLTRLDHLLTICPPTAGAINRMAGCLGEELWRPGEGEPLLVRCWTLGARRLRAAERRSGTNDPDGAIWVPEDEQRWDDRRKRHPGVLEIAACELSDPDAHNERRVRLERWALGPRFTHSIEVTAGWPNITATE